MRCLGKGTQALPSPILDYRAARYGLGVEGSEVPSGADEEDGNTTATFVQMRYSQGRTAGVHLVRSETITAIKIFAGHYHKPVYSNEKDEQYLSTSLLWRPKCTL